MSIYIRKCDSTLKGISLIETIKERYPELVTNEKFWTRRLKIDMKDAEKLFPEDEEWNKLTSYHKYLYCSTNFCDPNVQVEFTSFFTKKDVNESEFMALSITTVNSLLENLRKDDLLNFIVSAPVAEFITTRASSKAVKCVAVFRSMPIEQTDVAYFGDMIQGMLKGIPFSSCQVTFPGYEVITPFNPFNEDYLEYTVTTGVKDWMPHPSQFSASRLAGMMAVSEIEEFDCYLPMTNNGKSSTRVRMYLKENNRDAVMSKLQSLHKLLNKDQELEIHL